jgi:hypothetical protein
VRGYVVDVYFCVFDVSVEEFGVGFGFRIGFRIGFRLEIGLGLELNLTTNSLSASSLNTTTNNKSNSIGLNAGGNANTNSAKLNRVSLDAVLCLFRLLSLCERLCCRCLLLCL